MKRKVISNKSNKSNKSYNSVTKPNKNPGMSMVNNFNSIPADKYDAAEAKFYVTQLRKKTGRSEQSILTELVLTGFNFSDNFKTLIPAIKQMWLKTIPSDDKTQ